MDAKTLWPLNCRHCGKRFERSRPDAKTCSPACRQALRRSLFKDVDLADQVVDQVKAVQPPDLADQVVHQVKPPRKRPARGKEVKKTLPKPPRPRKAKPKSPPPKGRVKPRSPR